MHLPYPQLPQAKDQKHFFLQKIALTHVCQVKISWSKLQLQLQHAPQ